MSVFDTEDYIDAPADAFMRLEADIAAQLKAIRDDIDARQRVVHLDEETRERFGVDMIRIKEMVYNPDGSSSFRIDLSPEEMVAFAKIGIRQVVIEAARRKES
jgi:hypothetical protein